MNITITIDGTEVTIQDKGSAGDQADAPAASSSTDDLPPALAQAVAQGAQNGGRAPQAPSPSGATGTSSSSATGGDQSAGAAPAALLDRSS